MKRNQAMHNIYKLHRNDKKNPLQRRRTGWRWGKKLMIRRVMRRAIESRRAEHKKMQPRSQYPNMTKVVSCGRDIYRRIPERIFGTIRYPWRRWEWHCAGRGFGFREFRRFARY